MRASAFRLHLGGGDSTGAGMLVANMRKLFYSSNSVFCLARETTLVLVAPSQQLGRGLRFPVERRGPGQGPEGPLPRSAVPAVARRKGET